MKRLIRLAFPFALLLNSAVVSYAAPQWPPPAYYIPPVAYDTDVWENVFVKSLKISMGSISNTGFIILGVVISVVLITSVILGIFKNKMAIQQGVQKRKLNRAIGELDYRKNYDGIVDDKVRNMETSFSARRKFNKKHNDELIEESIDNKQRAYKAEHDFLRDNMKLVKDTNSLREESREPKNKRRKGKR